MCWNLGGHDSARLDFKTPSCRISASRMVQVDDDRSLLPTGKIVPVRGTPFDFESAAEVGSRISKVAEVEDRRSGRVLQIWSNQPALQFHTLNQLHAGGGKEAQRAGCAWPRAQGFPDAVNHPNFPSLASLQSRPNLSSEHPL